MQLQKQPSATMGRGWRRLFAVGGAALAIVAAGVLGTTMSAQAVEATPTLSDARVTLGYDPQGTGTPVAPGSGGGGTPGDGSGSGGPGASGEPGGGAGGPGGYGLGGSGADDAGVGADGGLALTGTQISFGVVLLGLGALFFGASLLTVRRRTTA